MGADPIDRWGRLVEVRAGGDARSRPCATCGGAVRSAIRRGLAGVARSLCTPLPPDDYLALMNPLWCGREPRGRVEAIHPETADAATLVIRPGRGWVRHRPGQWVRVGVDIEGARHWRTYSLSCPPGRPDGCITITVKAVRDGLVSRHLVRRTVPGTIVRLAGPGGEFVLPEPPPARLLFVTAGSGITPVRAMLHALLSGAAARDAEAPGAVAEPGAAEPGAAEPGAAEPGGVEPGVTASGVIASGAAASGGAATRRDAERRGAPDVVLLHSAPTPDDVIFGVELRALAARFANLRYHERHTRTGGRLRPAVLADLCPDWAERTAWVCGPAGMLGEATEHWSGSADRLHVEHFHAAAPAAGGEGGRIRFTKSGRQTDADGETPLLIAGERAGVLMPSGCRMGICHGCVGRLASGRVRDLRTGQVHGEAGDFVQTCVSAAAGPVEIEF